jgi:hypothetical protein
MALKGRFCDLLANFLGPVAPLVCEEHFAALAEDTTKAQARALIGHIAAEIGDERESAEFIKEASRELAAVVD